METIKINLGDNFMLMLLRCSHSAYKLVYVDECLQECGNMCLHEMRVFTFDCYFSDH